MSTRTSLHLDGRIMTANTFQDVEDIIENNKRLQKEAQRGDWRHKASIPNNILNKWLNEEWDRGNVNLSLFSEEMDRIVARKLRDPEWAYLRTDAPHLNGWLGFGS